MIRVVQGDVLSSDVNIIVQQVNARGKMGAGLAKKIKSLYPGIERGYKAICNTIPFETIRDSGYVYYYVISPTQRIASVFGQNFYGRDRIYTDYKALRNGLVSVSNLAKQQGLSVGIPQGIGCGLAGGDWSTVNGIINEVFKNTNTTIFRLGK